MKELLSDDQVFWGALAVSLVGGAGLALWMRRRQDPACGAGWAIITLVWPLWLLFGCLDRWLDVVTVRGVLAPYGAFILIGIVVGALFRRGRSSTAERQRPGGDPSL